MIAVNLHPQYAEKITGVRAEDGFIMPMPADRVINLLTFGITEHHIIKSVIDNVLALINLALDLSMWDVMGPG
jgi:hypothetical protein